MDEVLEFKQVKFSASQPRWYHFEPESTEEKNTILKSCLHHYIPLTWQLTTHEFFPVIQVIVKNIFFFNVRIILRHKSKANSAFWKQIFLVAALNVAFKHLESLNDSFIDIFYLKVNLLFSLLFFQEHTHTLTSMRRAQVCNIL